MSRANAALAVSPPRSVGSARARVSSRRANSPSRSSRRPVTRAGSSSSDAGLGETVGVVIVDHGSRRQASNDLLTEFVRMYREQTGRPIVELAHMEIAPPDIEAAFGRCVEQGATLVAVSPFFLSPGRHWQEDIPTLAAEAAAKHPGVSHFVAAPIGLHPLMTDIVDSRLETCMARLAGKGKRPRRLTARLIPAATTRKKRPSDDPLRNIVPSQAARATCAMGPSSGASSCEAAHRRREAGEGRGREGV